MKKQDINVSKKEYRRHYLWLERTDLWNLSRISSSRWFTKVHNKKVYISLCSGCKKDFIINLSRWVNYCPGCSKQRDADKQRMTRAIHQDRHLCKYCQKPLPKKYPNRVFCEGGACKQAAYRERKEMRSWIDMDGDKSGALPFNKTVQKLVNEKDLKSY